MTKAEEIFNQIIKEMPNCTEGKMFGAKCIKLLNGRTAAFLLKEAMVFKLDNSSIEEALKLEGAKPGAHIYAPDKPMKGWVSIPQKYANVWPEFTQKAILYLEKLKS